MAMGLYDREDITRYKFTEGMNTSTIYMRKRTTFCDIREDLRLIWKTLEDAGAVTTSSKNTFFPAAHPTNPNRIEGKYKDDVIVRVVAKYVLGVLPRIDTTITGDTVKAKELEKSLRDY